MSQLDSNRRYVGRLQPEGHAAKVRFTGGTGTTLNLTYEYQFGTQYLLINVATKTKNGVLTIQWRIWTLARFDIVGGDFRR